MESTPKENSTDDRRLWIGNLDPRVTEYQLLKLVQKHGAIEKFDLIFHRTGPSTGQPRGYAFVTFKEQEIAVAAKSALNNLLVGQKSIVVTWAHGMNHEEVEKPKAEIVIPALAMSKESKKTDRAFQIQAIEAKLKLMEKKTEEELKINDTVATKQPVIIQYQHNKTQATYSTSEKTKHKFIKHERCTKPYVRNRIRR